MSDQSPIADTEKTDSTEKTGDTEKMGDTEKTGEAEKIETLTRWSRTLAGDLGFAELDVDVDAVLALAGVAAREVIRPAAPLTTYLVGYAAGLAAARGTEPVSLSETTARIAALAARERS